MGNELHLLQPSGSNYYGRVRNLAGQVWNTTLPGFESWSNDNVAQYDVPNGGLTDVGGGHYVGDFSACSAGIYYVDYFLRAGESPAIDDRARGQDMIFWNGSARVNSIDSSGRVMVGSLPGTLEGALSIEEALRVILAALAGLSTGGGTASVKFRDLADEKDRIAATLSLTTGNRNEVVLDGT